MSALSPAPATSSGAPWADPLTPLDSALTDCCLSYKQNGPVSPLESALPNASRGGVPQHTRAALRCRHYVRHVAPLSPVASLDCAYFPSPRGCTTLCASDFSASAANPIGSSFLFILLQTAIPPTPFVSHPYKTPGVGAVLRRFAFPFARHPALATRIGSGALQDGAQLADVLKTFDGQDFLDQSCGGGSTKNGPDQVAGFGDYFVAGHGIFRRAAYVLHPLPQLRAVGERHLDDRLAARAARVDARIGDDLHFGALPQHRRIFHARFVVHRAEGDGLVQQHDRDHVLQADVRHIAVA